MNKGSGWELIVVWHLQIHGGHPGILVSLSVFDAPVFIARWEHISAKVNVLVGLGLDDDQRGWLLMFHLYSSQIC